ETFSMYYSIQFSVLGLRTSVLSSLLTECRNARVPGESNRTYDLAVVLYQEAERIRVRHFMKDQLLRAALSIVLNLAEGSAKPSPRDRQRFYRIAMGSLREVQSIADLLGHEVLQAKADRVGAHLYRLLIPKTDNGIPRTED